MSKGGDYSRQTTNLDPLENTDNFNIIQFLRESEFDTPEDDGSLVSPTSSAGSMQHVHHHPHSHPHSHHLLQNPHQQGYVQGVPRQQRAPGSLPESPPMTDICGNASSASSSSHHSDPMFSPNEFNGYNTANNNNGMILGVHQMAQQQQYAPQQQQQWPNAVRTPAENKPYMENLYNMLQATNEGGLASPIIEETSTGAAAGNRKRSRMTETPGIQDENYGPGCYGPPSGQQAIKFNKFQEDQWNSLYDQNGRELQHIQVHVVADKGFNHSLTDGCFVNQKKNHFQVSVHLEASDSMPPKFIFYNGSLVPIRDFKLAFCGVKSEMPSSEICIRQSSADRKPHPHTPVVFDIQERRVTKVTVPRLHFSETTLNNQRKNNRPNPEQKYFLLVVRLYASINDDVSVLIYSYASEKVIVRATNPGSFEPPDSDIAWQRNGNTLFTHGPVSIGTDRQAAKLTVDGDIYTTGKVITPSDIRLKENIVDKTASDALENLLKLRIVDYQYKPEVAEKWGLTEEQRKRTGLIAQELATVLPDAVRDIGEYLTIDESRVFYETVLATKELCRLTGDLDTKIDEKVEEISKRLAEYARKKKLASSVGSNLNSADSRSIYSMASTATGYSESRKKYTRRKRSASGYTPEPLCFSSRFTQGTIVTLIGVMAVCLLAMSALYVLDWHNRNYGYHHHHYTHHSTTPSSKGEPANLVVSPLRFMPTYQPDAPPLLAHCFSPSCRTYCCGAGGNDESTNDTPHSAVSANNVTSSGIGRAPQSAHREFGTGVEIRIPLLNTTLDQRYCIERSCNKRRGIFNLFVPVSRFMPDAPIEIQIDVPKHKVINNCGHMSDFQHKLCGMQSSKEYPTSHQILENTFELSVGSYIQSAYRFRVGYTPDSCFTGDAEASGNFEEYNLIFYRMCSTNSTTQASSTASPIFV
ncbi:unnamed protein product [Caenorhabditis angaria]|uniref:Myelin regulatory factor n=1 Tax=Caenorhabditis angaria TaxID=860376 RepID=A0A9P1N0Z4_9PELO|nr:unnamed protein product [Caenorhabditis angaria]